MVRTRIIGRPKKKEVTRSELATTLPKKEEELKKKEVTRSERCQIAAAVRIC